MSKKTLVVILVTIGILATVIDEYVLADHGASNEMYLFIEIGKCGSEEVIIVTPTHAHWGHTEQLKKLGQYKRQKSGAYKSYSMIITKGCT